MVNVTVEIAPGEVGEHERTPTSSELFGARMMPLDVTAPTGYVPCNPSILRRPQGGWLCSVRVVDYRLGVPCKTASSRNLLVELDEGLQIRSSREFHDVSGLPKNQRAKNTGFEDLRLYSAYGLTFALATACDIANGGGLPEMCRLAIGKNGTIEGGQVLRGPWSRFPQKNWTPVDNGRGDALYRIYPTLVMQPDFHQRWLDGRAAELDAYDFMSASVRGGSQAISWDDGYLAIVHEHKTKRPLSYVHRFVWFDKDLVARKVSRDFVWLAGGVEFCAGLATDGEKMVATFGVHDCRAYLTTFSPADVSAILKALEG